MTSTVGPATSSTATQADRKCVGQVKAVDDPLLLVGAVVGIV